MTTKKTKKTRSRYYIEKAWTGTFVVASKVTRTGPKQIDDLVKIRGTKSQAERRLEDLQQSEKKLLEKGKIA